MVESGRRALLVGQRENMLVRFIQVASVSRTILPLAPITTHDCIVHWTGGTLPASAVSVQV